MIESTKWAFWAIAVLVALTIVGWALRPISMRVEREVMVQSHQYIEGKAERIAILEANLAEVEARLVSATGDSRASLEAQRSALFAQIGAAKR